MVLLSIKLKKYILGQFQHFYSFLASLFTCFCFITTQLWEFYSMPEEGGVLMFYVCWVDV